MKKIILALSLLCLSSLYGTDMITLTQNEKEYLANHGAITMCVDPDWEPFEIINQKGKHEGIAADLIQLVAAKIGVKIELIKTKDWEETLEFSKSKKCDILSFLNDTPKRREWLTFTNPIFKDPNVLVGRSDEQYIEDISQKNLSIALPRGTAIAERFAQDFPNLTIIPTKSEAEAFSLVENRQADITLRSLIVTAYTIKKEGIFNLKIIGEPKGYENNLCIGVVKDKPILRDILNKGIVQLTKEDVDKIVNNHVKIIVEKVTYFTMALWGFISLVFISFIILLWNYTLRKRVALEVVKNLKQQELLLEQKRKAELGELIANISHQWKNGLAHIGGVNLHLMLLCDTKKQINTNELQKFTQGIETSIRFMSKTMEVFLNFYKDTQKYDIFNVIDSINDGLLFIDIPVKESKLDIVIVNNMELSIKANKNEWIHIWLNLFNNTLREIKKNNIVEPKVNIVIDNNQITYQDNCGGFDEITLETIKNNQTNGLGLKMSHNILLKYSWDMRIENKNNGALFTIFQK